MSAWGKADDKTSTGTVALSAFTATFNGADDVASNTITVTAHPFRNGDKVNYVDGGGTQIDGLVDTTDYFITNATTNTVQLAATQADALHNNPTVLTFTDGVGASHALTLTLAAGTRGKITGAGGADFEGAGQEAFVGDVITSGAQSMVILSIESATTCTVESLDRGTALTAFSAAQYTLNEKPLSIGADANISASEVFGVDATEIVGGSDNIVNAAVTEGGTGYQEIPTVTVAAPSAITVTTANVSLAADTITITNHNLTTGDKLTYANGGGADMTVGGSAPTVVYVIRVDENTIQLASSESNANAGTEYDIDGAGNNAQTFTGDTATVTAAISGGAVTALTVTDPGSGYTGSVPAATIEKPTITIPTADVTATDLDSIEYTAHGFAEADEVRYQDGGGTALAGLTDNTVYYVSGVGLTADNFRLATTAALAAGEAVPTTAVGDTSGGFTIATSDGNLAVGDRVVITGTLTGTATITGYTSGTIYKVSAVTGAAPNNTAFTLTEEDGTAIVTTAGTTTGLTLEGYTIIDLTGTGNNDQFFEKNGETRATATAALGLGGPGGGGTGAAHSGWVKRTVGTGARAGRVQYEVLVALSKNGITGDAADDLELPED